MPQPTLPRRTASQSFTRRPPERLAEGERACIIGAGCSGLAAAKALSERGIPYDHFEESEDVGGIWQADRDDSPVYENLRLITSKSRTAFSDHGLPEDAPTYGHHTDMRAFLRSYARRFGLTEGIQFGTEVTSVRPADEEGEEWIVETDESEERRYGAVLVCSGHHRAPRWPQVPGRFEGGFSHAREYWSPGAFDGDRVLVIGIGNSGAGIATDLAEDGRAEHVAIAVRSGTWVVPRYLFGIPTDQWSGAYQTHLPFKARSTIFRLLILLSAGRQKGSGISAPSGRNPMEEHPTINDELLPLARAGKLAVRPGIERFEGHRVRFTDGTYERFDRVVCATGYEARFPFLPNEVLEDTPERASEVAGRSRHAEGQSAKDESIRAPLPRLYRQVMPPERAGLHFVGLLQPAGAIAPLAERQSQWIARLLSGEARLPSQEAMQREIDRTERERRVRYHDSPRHRMEVDFWDYARAVEKEISL